MHITQTSLRTILVFCALILLLSGCASTAQQVEADSDPLERYNRAMFSFNKAVDSAILKPIAQGYKAVTPDVVDQGISNFFSNLGDTVVVANDLLQIQIRTSRHGYHAYCYQLHAGLAGLD